MIQKTLHIGFDDTDSVRKGCTTHVASLLVEKLCDLGASFLDYPNLIRLNPNVPWKTRGNGALCLRIRYDENIEEKLKENVIKIIEQNSDIESERTDPGIVFFSGKSIPGNIQFFGKRAITDVMTLQLAMKLLKKHTAEALGFKNGRGIIGALAAVGNVLNDDYTFEVLAYRSPENIGSKRGVDEKSIFTMNERTRPLTFNNIDEEKNRIIITPRGPDPILFGVRGETAEIVKQAFAMVRTFEPVDRWMIFRSNQGTDAHLKRTHSLGLLEPYSSVVAKGTVSSNPRVIRGRHVVFSIRDEAAETDCVAYEPTGVLHKIARELMTGDTVEVYGAVRAHSSQHGVTINLEKIQLVKLTPKRIYLNPVCSKCGRRLKSMGSEQGLRCDKCRSKYPKMGKVEISQRRAVKKGLYFASSRSQRHLTKPSIRYGQEKGDGWSGKMIDDWHFP